MGVPGCEHLPGGWPGPPRCHAGTHAHESCASSTGLVPFLKWNCPPHASHPLVCTIINWHSLDGVPLRGTVSSLHKCAHGSFLLDGNPAVLSPPWDPTRPASALFTGHPICEHPQTSAQPLWKTLSRYGLDCRAVSPPSSCAIHRSHPFTLLTAFRRPTPVRAQKARNRLTPQHRAHSWCCGESS